MSRAQRVFGSGLLLALGLGPLACLPALEDAYRLPQLLALGLAALLLGTALLMGMEFAKPRGALALMGLFYFGWRALSHLSSGPWDAAWVLEWGLYAALFGALAGASLLSRARAFEAALWAAAAVSLYACAQGLGWDPLAKDAVELGFSARAYATLGNPDFLGGYLALALPLALDAWLRKRWRAWVVILIATALALTQARAAWLAAGLGGVWVAGQAWRAGSLSGLKLTGLLTMPLALLLLLTGTHALNPRGLDSLQRLASLADAKDDGWQGRLAMGRATLDVVRAHPLSGVGAGRFAEAYAVAQGKRLNAQGGAYRNTPHAHNDWLQQAAESGLPGLALLVAVWALACARAYRTQAWGAGGALLAFSVHAAAHFPLAIVPSAALFWALLGSLVAQREQPLGQAYVKAAGALLLVLGLLSLFVFGRQAQASALLRRGHELALAGKPELAKLTLAQAARLWPQDSRAPLALAVQCDRLEDYVGSLAAAQAALRAQSASPEAWNIMGLSLGKQGDLAGAEAVIRRSLELNPLSHEAWGNLATALAGGGDLAGARQALQRALLLKPDWVMGLQNLAVLDAALKSDGAKRAR